MKKKIISVVVLALMVFSISRIDFKTPEQYNNDDKKTQLTNTNKTEDQKTTKENNKNKKTDKKKNDKTKTKTQTSNTKTPTSQNKTKPKQTKNDLIKVSIYIDVTNLNKKKNNDLLKPELKKYVPASGYILNKKTIEVKDKTTVFDVLQNTVRTNRIQMDYQGANENVYNSVYVRGINHLYEFSAGSESGWMYTVNGVILNYGMSQAKLKNNDVIRIVYTCNLGCDIDSSSKQCQ